MAQKNKHNISHTLHFDSAATKDMNSYEIKGFQEVIFSVRNIKKSIQFYRSTCAWELLFEAPVSRMQLNFWNLPDTCSAQEALLHNPGDNEGFLRLVSFEGVEQQHIRSSGQSWDTGGIYDVDVRVVNIDSSFLEFQKAGWTGFNDPIEYKFGKFHITEGLIKGPEDTVFALIERHKPVLEGYPNLRKVSHIFNSSQVVSDMERAKDFYINKLGFQIYMENSLSGSEKDENVFGMPQNLYRSIERNICILNPKGINRGSVELVELKGAEGKNFANLAVPPNLGILMLRFPVRNIEMLQKSLQNSGIKPLHPVSQFHIEPYGTCKSLVVKTPDGAWLEFIELIDTP